MTTLHAFNRLLHQRRDEDGRQMSVSRLADLAVVGRSHLTQVLAGRRAGTHTWPLIFPWLTAHETAMLGKLGEYLEWHKFHVEKNHTP